VTPKFIGGALLAVALGAPTLGAPTLSAQESDSAKKRDGAQQSDSAKKSDGLFTRTDAWLAGGFVVGVAVALPFDERIAVWSQQPSVQGNNTASSLASAFNFWGGPGVFVASFGIYGGGRIAGSRSVSELGLRASEAVLISSAITGITKGIIGRQRPDVDIHDPDYFVLGKGFTNGQFTSMPSGHTTAAFAFAASVTDETAHLWPRQTWWVATLTYGSAVATGWARIYSNAHWTSDVVTGAMVGTITGLAVNRWHRVHPNSKLDKWLLPNGITPTKGGAALTWSRTF
jgi:membrane-associated phospholipid phosphatase